MSSAIPQVVKDAVLFPSVTVRPNTPIIKGYDWKCGVDYDKIIKSFLNCGQQATNFGLAVEEINKMIGKRKEPFPASDFVDEEDEYIRPKSNLTLFLGYTSNMITSGTRETICYLTKHGMIDCLVTTAGGVEEDLIKCLAPSYVGRFQADDKKLREAGINRAGNVFIPNQNYCLFENWVMPLLDQMWEEQNKNGMIWTPSTMIAKLGKEMNNEDSVYYWAWRNKIPVFCPALTDGSLGDMMYFHSFKKSGLILDIVRDLRRINTMAVRAKNTGMIILGGGVVKHHICNANLMRNGANFGVFINTGNEFDGSDSGARPEEAVSWGKIRKDANPVKIYADASLVFPLIVAQTFAKDSH